MDFFSGSPWALVTVIGAFVLLAAIGYGMWQNSKRTSAQRMLTEMATKREYEREDKERPDAHIPT
jgi:hypothetical protein